MRRKPTKRCVPPMPCARRKTSDRKSTRLNSSHGYISYAVFCLKKKKRTPHSLCAWHAACTDTRDHAVAQIRHRDLDSPHDPGRHTRGELSSRSRRAYSPKMNPQRSNVLDTDTVLRFLYAQLTQGRTYRRRL